MKRAAELENKQGQQEMQSRVAMDRAAAAAPGSKVFVGRSELVPNPDDPIMHGQWKAEMEARRALIDREIAERAERRAGRKAVQIGRVPTVAQRKIAKREMKDLMKEGGRRVKRPMARSKMQPRSTKRFRGGLQWSEAERMVMREQGERTGRAPRGISPERAVEQHARMGNAVSLAAAMSGWQMGQLVKTVKRMMREKAVAETEKVVEGRTYELRRKGWIEEVTALKKKKSKVVVLLQTGQVRKVSPFDLVLDGFVPGTRRVGRTELQTVRRVKNAKRTKGTKTTKRSKRAAAPRRTR